MDESRILLDLLIRRLPGISLRGKILLLEAFSREEDFLATSQADLEGIAGKTRRSGPWNMDALRSEAERDLMNSQRRGILMVSYREPQYPPLLREIYDPPAVLFYRGTLPDPAQPLLAMAGTRKPTGGGSAAAYDIAKTLGRGGIPVVSGLALGIDAMVHRGNLDGGAGTIAVLGSGLDMIYPASNRPLARKILDSPGALMSEYPPLTQPRRWHFPARNRIISGLARGTLIVEAPASSGALITAQFALDQGRDLLVTRLSLDSFQGEGTAALARDGAKVISRGEDILSDWGIEPPSVGIETGEGNSLESEGAKLADSLARTLNISL